MKKTYKYITYNFIIIIILAVIIETIFFSARLFLKRNSVGFLISLNAEQNKYLNDDCLRMQTHILLSHSHDTKQNCQILGASKYNDNFIWYNFNENSDNKIRILTLGGSTTDGYFYHISNFKTWPYLLSQICKKNNLNCEVINGGVGGYNTTQELLKYLIYSKSLGKIDYVISLNGINELNTSRDLNRKLKKEYPFQTKIQYLMTTDESWLKQNELKIILFPNVLSFFNFKRNYDFNYGLNKLINKDEMNNFINKRKKENLDYNIDIWHENLKNLNTLAESNNSKFLSILQPTMGLDDVKIIWRNKGNDHKIYQKFFDNPLRYEVNYFYKEAKEICNELKYCFDLSGIAKPGSDDLFYNARHHNEKGNYIIANEIFSIISNN